MDKETYRVLASVRMERAIGLVDEAQKCNHTLRLICLRKTEQKNGQYQQFAQSNNY